MHKIWLLLMLLCCTQLLQAQTFYVPSQYSTIQSAIDNALDGDNVVVLPGTYFENIDFKGKAVTIQSADPNDPNVVAATIIDGSNPADPNFGSVATFKNGEDNDSVLTGFTIQNGTGHTDPTVNWRLWTGTNGDGGGALCSSTSPTITKNIFKNCHAQYGGGGIFCNNNASPVITYNTFLNNYAGWYGGAVFARLQCSPTISNNTFKQNDCVYLGGAVYLADQCYSKVTNNWFEENNSEVMRGGALYYFVNSAPTIACNFFISNTASATGSAISTSAGSSGAIINNYFSGNSTRDPNGAAIMVSISGNGSIANNIIVENADVGIATDPGVGSPTFYNNDVWNNSVSNYGGTLSDQTGINGNISADPKINEPNSPEPFTSFYELNADSPCINAGNNASVPAWLTVDYDGTSRVVCGVVDIGPQEFSSLRVPQDFNTIQGAINAAQSGDEIIVSPGFYRENINFLTKNIRLQSVNYLDPNCVAQTVIDGGGVDSCIAILGGQDESTVVAGLWIQNGHAQFGGGIHVDSSVGPVLMYNYITQNSAYKPAGALTGGYGGGIDSRNYAYSEVSNNTITGNFAEVAGGGIHVGPQSSCTIKNNRILDNVAAGEAGGGIYCYDKTTAWITGNEISGNQALNANGGGIWEWESPGGLIEDNIIFGNIATATSPGSSDDGCGGGIGLFYLAATLVRNNLICGNKADYGGGICLRTSSTSEIVNNTIVGNMADTNGAGIAAVFGIQSPIINNIVAYNGPGGGIYIYPTSPHPNTSHLNLTANDSWNNQGGNYAGDINDPTGTAGNVSADPCFIDPGHWDANGTPDDTNDDYWVQGDYRIGYFSACRDAGIPDINAPVVDIDGNPRPHFAGLDIGAYELQIYDLTTTGTVDFTDVALLADFWLAEGELLPADLNGDGRVDFRDFALLSGDWQK